MIDQIRSTIVFRTAVLTVVLFVMNFLTGLVFSISDSAQSETTFVWFGGMFLTYALHAGMLSSLVLQSRWRGFRLVATIFLAYFGITVFLTHIEGILFLDYLVDIIPTETLILLIWQGTIVAALFAPAVVLAHGKMSGQAETIDGNNRLVMPWWRWLMKLSTIGVVYVIIYMLFGLLVAMPLMGPAFEEYYGDLQLPVWFLPFQVVRGVIWGAIAIPVIRMLPGDPGRTRWTIALLFSVLMGSLLIAPNAFMPDRIRLAHFVEVTSSNFVFGWIVAWMLLRWK